MALNNSKQLIRRRKNINIVVAALIQSGAMMNEEDMPDITAWGPMEAFCENAEEMGQQIGGGGWPVRQIDYCATTYCRFSSK